MKKIFSMITLAVLMVALAGSCTKNIEERIDKADTDVATLQTAIGQYEKLQSDITSVIQALRNEVGSRPASEQQTVWECIAALQSQNNTVSAAIGGLKTLVGEESVSGQIDDAVSELISKYSLESLEATLKGLKDEVARKFNVEALKGQVEQLDKTLRKCSNYIARIDAFKGLVQSVSIIPAYSNGSIKADAEGLVKFECAVTPASVLADISDAELAKCFTLTLSTVGTKAGESAEIAVTSAEVADPENGIVEITADISDYIPEDGSQTLMLALNLKLGASNLTSGFTKVYATPTLPAGALPGEFTVNADGKKVHFSQGNLTYNVTDTKWAFYEHQYDCATVYDSNLISLFTWGYDAVKSIVPDGTNYVEGHSTGETFSKTEDWGYVFGGESSVWHTLTIDEWSYLFNTRTMTNRKERYSNTMSSGVTIGGTTYKGVFLYPDNYNGEVVSSSMTWDAINAAGIVFLPAAGARYESGVSDVGTYGFYWSSTADDSTLASVVYVTSGGVFLEFPGNRSDGYSVRLVTEVK